MGRLYNAFCSIQAEFATGFELRHVSDCVYRKGEGDFESLFPIILFSCLASDEKVCIVEAVI